MRLGWGVLLIPLILPLVRAQDINEDLLTAARRGNLEEVKALLGKGADIETKTRYGITPLFFAARNGHEAVVRHLIERGAKVDVTDTFYKSTAIGSAADNGHAGVVQMLLAKDASGRDEVLGIAVRRKSLAMAKTALQAGKVTPHALTSSLIVAQKDNLTEIVELLKTAGASIPTVDPTRIASYAGKYKSEGAEWEFQVRDGKLNGGPAGQMFDLTPLDETTFLPGTFTGVTVQFQVEQGKVTGFVVKQPSGTTKAKRVE